MSFSTSARNALHCQTTFWKDLLTFQSLRLLVFLSVSTSQFQPSLSCWIYSGLKNLVDMPHGVECLCRSEMPGEQGPSHRLVFSKARVICFDGWDFIRLFYTLFNKCFIISFKHIVRCLDIYIVYEKMITLECKWFWTFRAHQNLLWDFFPKFTGHVPRLGDSVMLYLR